MRSVTQDIKLAAAYAKRTGITVLFLSIAKQRLVVGSRGNGLEVNPFRVAVIEVFDDAASLETNGFANALHRCIGLIGRGEQLGGCAVALDILDERLRCASSSKRGIYNQQRNVVVVEKRGIKDSKADDCFLFYSYDALLLGDSFHKQLFSAS